MSKVCIFGAGAIGGLIGARLALKGEAEVSLVARGPHLEAMKAKGLTLKQAGETHVVHPKVTDRPSRPRTAGLHHPHPQGPWPWRRD